MEQIAAVLLLVACSDDMSNCTEQTASQQQYASQTECEQGIGDVLQASAVLSPIILGKCLPVDSASLDGGVRVSWNINPAGELLAYVDGGSFARGTADRYAYADGVTAAQ